VDPTQLKAVIGRLSPGAFNAFSEALMGLPAGRAESFRVQQSSAFWQPLLDSYGGSLHTVFLRHDAPLNFLTQVRGAVSRDARLTASLRRIRAAYKSKQGAWGMVSPHLVPARTLQSLVFLTALSGFTREDYDQVILPEYAVAARKAGLHVRQVLVGSPDSYVDLKSQNTEDTLLRLMATDADGLRIVLDGERIVVEKFQVETVLRAGVAPHPFAPLQPVYVQRNFAHDTTVREFESLLNERASEARLEEFLRVHHRAIFGPTFDRIETQVWLPFPEADIAGRPRRADLFMRSSVDDDWTLWELKRANVPVVSIRRGQPSFSRHVVDAIEQVRRYGRLLMQTNVRESFRQRGIDYFEPQLVVAIGRAPPISHAHWRWLVSRSPEVRIATYDDLLTELRLRAVERDELKRLPEKGSH
jgi:hypothetical protein